MSVSYTKHKQTMKTKKFETDKSSKFPPLIHNKTKKFETEKVVNSLPLFIITCM